MTSWLRLDAGTIWDPRILALPSDETRWCYVEALCFAKLQQPEGVFRSAEQYGIVTRRSPEVLSQLVRSGLVDQDDSGIWIVGWDELQMLKDKTGRERQRRWRARQIEARNALRNASRNDLPDGTHPTDTQPHPDADRTPTHSVRTKADGATNGPRSATDVVRQIVFSATGSYPDSVGDLKIFDADEAIDAVRRVAGSTLDPNELIAQARATLQKGARNA